MSKELLPSLKIARFSFARRYPRDLNLYIGMPHSIPAFQRRRTDSPWRAFPTKNSGRRHCAGDRQQRHDSEVFGAVLFIRNNQ